MVNLNIIKWAYSYVHIQAHWFNIHKPYIYRHIHYIHPIFTQHRNTESNSFTPICSLKIVDFFFSRFDFRGDQTHTHNAPSGPLDLFELLTCQVWPGVEEAHFYLGFSKVGLNSSTLRLTDLIPQCMTNMSVNPLVRCLFINLFCYLMPRLAYLFIYLILNPLVQNPLVHQYPLGLYYIITIIIYYLSVQDNCGVSRKFEFCDLKISDFGTWISGYPMASKTAKRDIPGLSIFYVYIHIFYI